MNTNPELTELLGIAGLRFEVVYDGDAAYCPCNAASHSTGVDPDQFDADQFNPDRPVAA